MMADVRELGPIGTGIVQELRKHRGHAVSVEQLHERLYGTQRDGGAQPVSIQKAIHRLRKAGVQIHRISGYAIF